VQVLKNKPFNEKCCKNQRLRKKSEHFWELNRYLKLAKRKNESGFLQTANDKNNSDNKLKNVRKNII